MQVAHATGVTRECAYIEGVCRGEDRRMTRRSASGDVRVGGMCEWGRCVSGGDVRVGGMWSGGDV